MPGGFPEILSQKLRKELQRFALVTDVVARQLQGCSTKHWIHIGAIFKQIHGPIAEASRAPVLYRASYDQLPCLMSGKHGVTPVGSRRAVVFEKRDDGACRFS